MSNPIEPKFPKRRFSAFYSREMEAPDGCYLLPLGSVTTTGDWSWTLGEPEWVRCSAAVATTSDKFAWTYARKLPDGQQNDDMPAAGEENGICSAEELRHLQEHGTAEAIRLFRESLVCDAARAAPVATRSGNILFDSQRIPEILDRLSRLEAAAPATDLEMLSLIREFTPVAMAHYGGNPANCIGVAATMARKALEEARKGVTPDPSAPAAVQPPHPDAPRLLMTHDGKVTAFGAIEAPPGCYLLPAGEVMQRGDYYLSFDGWRESQHPGHEVGHRVTPEVQFRYARKLPPAEGRADG